MVEADDVDDLLHEQRVGGQLEPVLEWGLRSNFRQIRPMVDLLRPDRSAIDARDQWVASFGISSRVATTTSST